jgi:hypothetical protein
VRAIGRAIGRYPQLQKQVSDAAEALSWDTDGRALVDAYASLQASPARAGILDRHSRHTKEGP